MMHRVEGVGRLWASSVAICYYPLWNPPTPPITRGYSHDDGFHRKTKKHINFFTDACVSADDGSKIAGARPHREQCSDLLVYQLVGTIAAHSSFICRHQFVCNFISSCSDTLGQGPCDADC